MIKYDKVVRIGLDSEIFHNNVSQDSTELWTDYDNLSNMPFMYNFLNIYYPEELESLKNKYIDYIALSDCL